MNHLYINKILNLLNKFNYSLTKKKYLIFEKQQKEIEKNIFHSLSLIMNNITKKSNDEKYWRRTILPWLNYFIPVYIHRKLFYLNKLKKFKDKNKIFERFIKINKIKNQVDYMYLTNNLNFNYLFLSNINFFYENIENKKKTDFFKKCKFISDKSKINDNKNKFEIKSVIKNYLFSLIDFIWKLILPKKYILFTNPHRFDFFSMIKIIIYSRFTAYFQIKSANLKNDYVFDVELREKLYLFLIKYSKLDKLFIFLFVLYLPTTKLELFSKYNISKLNQYFKKKLPQVIFSSGSHIENEESIHLLAEASIMSKKINIIQHGNNYNLISRAYHSGIEGEYLYDYLYTWGWKNNSSDIICSSPRLYNTYYKVIKKNILNANNRILFVLAPIKEYDFIRSFHYLPKLNTSNNILRKKLLENLPSKFKSIFYFRMYPYPNYDGVKNEKKLEKEFKNIQFDTSDKYNSIANSSIFIFDHLSTFLLEIINLDKPFLLYFDYDNYNLSNNAKKLFDKLYKNKILHKNSETLIKFLQSERINKFNSYYFNKERLSLYNFIKRNYANISINHSTDWSNKIKSLLKD